jgi:hypothetical protein
MGCSSWATAAALLVVVVVAACSSGSGDPSSGGQTGSCSSVCATAVQLGCTTKSQSECVADCEQSLAGGAPQCGPAQMGLATCMLGAFGCDLSSASGSQLLNACPAEFASYAGCTACLPESGDDACDACAKSKCCAQREAFLGDVESMKYAMCIVDCGHISACVSGCESSYPGALPKLETYANCLHASCSGC